MGYIYKITNDINGKIYIGKTKLFNPNERWKQHLHDYKNRKNENRPLYKAMLKYGCEHFHFELIEETSDLENREKYWISFFRTYVGFNDCNGYNATLGGDGKCYLELDENEVIKYHIEKAGYILKNTTKHFKVDKKTIREILLRNNIKIMSAIEYSQNFNMKKVCKIDVEANELLEIFDSYAAANIHMGKSKKSSVIRMATYGKLKTAYGYKWLTYDDYLKSNIISNTIIA